MLQTGFERGRVRATSRSSFAARFIASAGPSPSSRCSPSGCNIVRPAGCARRTRPAFGSTRHRRTYQHQGFACYVAPDNTYSAISSAVRRQRRTLRGTSVRVPAGVILDTLKSPSACRVAPAAIVVLDAAFVPGMDRQLGQRGTRVHASLDRCGCLPQEKAQHRAVLGWPRRVWLPRIARRLPLPTVGVLRRAEVDHSISDVPGHDQGCFDLVRRHGAKSASMITLPKERLGTRGPAACSRPMDGHRVAALEPSYTGTIEPHAPQRCRGAVSRRVAPCRPRSPHIAADAHGAARASIFTDK
ncbi:MAG: hypothetical protein QOK11_1874 [Pseudonocardiales bacterium]|nr:hypothetical protein [Pseudonocardiales bacterium]